MDAPEHAPAAASPAVDAFARIPGAVSALDEGAPNWVPLHYGDPLGEQRRLRAGAAVLLPRGVVTVSGPDRHRWLDSFTSQLLTSLSAGQSAEALILDPNGRIEHALRIVEDGESMWLLVEPDEVARLVRFLTMMRFRSQVEVTDRSADVFVLGSFGPSEAVAALAADAPVWQDGWARIAPGGHGYADPAAHPAQDWNWSEAVLPLSALDSVTEAIAAGQLPVAGLLAYEALRIAAWRPELRTEVDDRAIPHETDWMRTAVHLNKGCYRGQETVAKVHNLGHPPRRLVMLHLDGSDAIPVQPGDLVALRDADDAGRPVGRVTAAGMHYELGPIALALVKRGLDPAAALVVRSGGGLVAAAAETIVPTDAGATVRQAGLGRPRTGH